MNECKSRRLYVTNCGTFVYYKGVSHVGSVRSHAYRNKVFADAQGFRPGYSFSDSFDLFFPERQDEDEK